MNSYNENLHTSVLSSLNAQELNLQKTKANLDASMFSLYYAEGARITAAEKLQVANANYKFQQEILEQIVIDSDVSTNLLSSVNSGNEFISTSVKNTSVAAANVQIAANAVLKLASDVGSIFSIVNAADFGSEIYDQAEYANILMNGEGSENRKDNKKDKDKGTAYLAEQASQLSMEASALIAEIPIASLVEKAQTTDTSIKSLLEVVTGDFVVKANTVKEDSEALVTANVAEKKAEGDIENIDTVYRATQKAYNISNRELNLNLTANEVELLGSSDLSYEVSFNRYKSPFTIKNSSKAYPVESYYIFLVKNDRKEIFSMANAEGLITEVETEKKYLKITSEDIDSYKINISTNEEDDNYLKDTDGEDFELGEKYVVFVLAVLENSYKKTINTFDDYLSAPSACFSLKNKLNKAKTSSIKVTADTLSFTVVEDKDFNNVEYRCMFLPHNPELTQGLLTAKELEKIEQEVEDLSADYLKYIKEREGLELELGKLIDEIDTQRGQELKKSTSDANTLKKLEEKKKKLEKKLKEVNEKIARLKDKDKPGFFFNYTIATGLETDSYQIANTQQKEEEDRITYTCSLKIDEFTNDNFGNSLIPNASYIPVVLAMPNALVNKIQFIGALSTIEATKSFTYKG